MTPPILFGSHMRWVRTDGQSYWVAINGCVSVRVWEGADRHYWQTRVNGLMFCHGDQASRRLAFEAVKRALRELRQDIGDLMQGKMR